MSEENLRRRRRVLHLIKGLGAGGAERIVWWHVRAGDHDRFDYDVAYVDPTATTLAGVITDAGATVHCVNGTRTTDPGWVRRLRQLLITGEYDVVHMHSPLVSGITRFVARSLPAAKRPILVSTEHCTWASYRVATKLVNAALYRFDDARFASSQQVHSSIWPGCRGGTEVLVHGLMREDLPTVKGSRESLRSDLALDADDVVIVTVANFREQKAYPQLLEVALRVTSGHPRVRFLFVGYGPLEADIKMRAHQLGLTDRIQFLGHRADVMQILAASDLFALASHYEGGPLAVMEAMAAGLAVVATSVGFVPDIITDGVDGLIVPPRRPDLLAARIEELVIDAVRRDQLGNAAAVRSEGFDVTTAVRRIEATYHRLLDDQIGPRGRS